MIEKKLKTRLEAFLTLKEDLLQAILDEMARIGDEMDLDEIALLHCGNAFTRNGREVTSKRLEELDDFLLDHVYHGGIEAIWRKGQGWV